MIGPANRDVHISIVPAVRIDERAGHRSHQAFARGAWAVSERDCTVNDSNE